MHITEESTSSSYKLVGEVAGVLKMTGQGTIHPSCHVHGCGRIHRLTDGFQALVGCFLPVESMWFVMCTE